MFTIEPIMSNTANYPDHSILLTLRLGGVSAEQVEVRHPLVDLGGRTRLALSPKDARPLADLLRRHAEAVNQEANNESPTRSPNQTLK
ncbi:hypothetical protein F4X33_05100 [Candidatus Poribacteria bacterium]|nr:hypothetical protein [Candidatus Poribacteria bacterium]